MAWYTAASSGATCVAAYDAIGAASLADSYVNEANPGTNNAAPGTAPTWAYGTGWTFTGTQILTTGVTPANDQSWSMIVRLSGASAALLVIVGSSVTAGQRFELVSSGTGARWANGGFKPGVAVQAGVMCVAGSNGYLDGVGAVSGITAWTGAAAAISIGGRNAAPQYIGNIAALAIYSGTIDATDVATITAAMLALPTVAAKGLPVIAHHWAQQFGVEVG